MGGTKLTYDGLVSTPKANLTTAKIHWSSVLYTPDGKYLIVYFQNFYLKNPMKKAEYYRIAIKLTPQEIIYKYDLKNKQRVG